MELIADGLLIATGLTAGLYCLILSRRLRRLTDSGNGIGAQIEALDRALAETRSALAETREGVGDLRGSVRSAQAQLARDVVQASELAGQLEVRVAEAEAALQRLYQAGDRLETYHERLDRSGAATVTAQAIPATGPGGLAEPDSGSTAHGSAGQHATGFTRVELPDGTAHSVLALGRDAGAQDVAGPVAAPATRIAAETGARSGRGGGILKAERMML